MTIAPSPFDGWLKAEPDEPTFTLMARDWRAPNMVKQWAYERARDIATGRKPEADRPMVTEARRIARAMEDWYREHRAGEQVRPSQEETHLLLRGDTDGRDPDRQPGGQPGDAHPTPAEGQ
jgi:hypothetical protein